MTTTQAESATGVCQRCDRESEHLIRQVAPDNSVHYVCWDCLRREEKHVNVSHRFKRARHS
ncbi:MAG TPA: hypothetical protein VE821_09350 [Pyrinomonadaceae bacterium]|nr:hypothetical protein [Pyrinomonadaceae bacterium]